MVMGEVCYLFWILEFVQLAKFGCYISLGF